MSEMDNRDTVTFRRCNVGQEILKGLKSAKEAMIKEGLWNENTTYEDWHNYAGSHILINATAKSSVEQWDSN